MPALFDVEVREVAAEPTAPRPPAGTKCWLVDGPGGKWSVWDFGDEMTVHRGPGLLDDVAATIPGETCRRLTAAERWFHVESAARSIHTAKLMLLLVADAEPTFRHLWR